MTTAATLDPTLAIAPFSDPALAGLHERICAEPWVEDWRHLYADRCHALGYDPDRGNPAAYGDFIKAQLELAKMPRTRFDNDVPKLRARESALLTEHGATWARVLLGPLFHGRKGFIREDGYYASAGVGGRISVGWSWHGGFPSHFRMTLAALVGGECECFSGGPAPGPDDDCQTCRGTGRTPGLADTLAGRVPVCEIVLTDRRPGANMRGRRDHNSGQRFCWIRFDSDVFRDDTPQMRLPDELFDRLPPEGMAPHRTVWYADTEPAALTALSHAAVDLCRSRAGPACERCKGTGTINHSYLNVTNMPAKCPDCRGTGRVELPEWVRKECSGYESADFRLYFNDGVN